MSQPLKLNGKFYRTVIQPTMLYGAECWLTQRQHVQQVSVAEMHMLWWICANTRRDCVQNDDICERFEVTPLEEKLVQHHLRWFGHIQQRSMETLVRSEVRRQISNERRGRERSNLIWEEPVKRDLKDWCIATKLELDRREWKLAIHVAEPWSLVPSPLLSFLQSFSSSFHSPFSLFSLVLYCLFTFF
jgi:hypothetical protein